MSLEVGDTAIPVVVTAEDSSTTTYTVTVTRAAATGADLNIVVHQYRSGSKHSDISSAVEGTELEFDLWTPGDSPSAPAGDVTVTIKDGGTTTTKTVSIGAGTGYRKAVGNFTSTVDLDSSSARNLVFEITSVPSGYQVGDYGSWTVSLTDNGEVAGAPEPVSNIQVARYGTGSRVTLRVSWDVPSDADSGTRYEHHLHPRRWPDRARGLGPHGHQRLRPV